MAGSISTAAATAATSRVSTMLMRASPALTYTLPSRPIEGMLLSRTFSTKRFGRRMT